MIRTTTYPSYADAILAALLIPQHLNVGDTLRGGVLRTAVELNHHPIIAQAEVDTCSDSWQVDLRLDHQPHRLQHDPTEGFAGRFGTTVRCTRDGGGCGGTWPLPHQRSHLSQLCSIGASVQHRVGTDEARFEAPGAGDVQRCTDRSRHREAGHRRVGIGQSCDVVTDPGLVARRPQHRAGYTHLTQVKPPIGKTVHQRGRVMTENRTVSQREQHGACLQQVPLVGVGGRPSRALDVGAAAHAYPCPAAYKALDLSLGISAQFGLRTGENASLAAGERTQVGSHGQRMIRLGVPGEGETVGLGHATRAAHLCAAEAPLLPRHLKRAPRLRGAALLYAARTPREAVVRHVYVARGGGGARLGGGGARQREAAAGAGRGRSGQSSLVPAERRFSQASTTRAAIDSSAVLPQARGSYSFLLPTSPSTFSTPE